LQSSRKTLADKYEYVMYGKLYKINEDNSGANLKVYVYNLVNIYALVDTSFLYLI